MKIPDLKHHALKLLKLSSRFLVEDHDLDPTAFIVTADDQILRPIDLSDESSKASSCRKIIEEARQQKALAIITIFLARSKNFESGSFVQADYSWGDIQNRHSERCILVTISGPGIKNWVAALPYRSYDTKIILGKRVEFADGVDLGLFPGWSEQIAGPLTS